MKTYICYRIELGIFKAAAVDVWVGEDLGFISKQEGLIMNWEEGISTNDFCGIVRNQWHDGIMDVLIKPDVGAGTLSEEAVHLANRIFAKIRYPIRTEPLEDELYASLVNFLTREMESALNRYHDRKYWGFWDKLKSSYRYMRKRHWK